MRKFGILLAALLCALVSQPPRASAQAPAPVPALPDTERRTTYTISAATGPYDVGFAVYGDGTDYANWIEVWLNGVRLTPVTQWTLSLASGSLTTSARPLTNARVTLVTAGTGTLQIVGARRPRRTAQFAENRGVAARDLNQALSDIIAQNRETWDKTDDLAGRMVQAPPGETLTVLPPAASRASQYLCFNSAGNLATCTTPLQAPIITGAGVDTSILATGIVIASAPTVDSTFCGKTAALGGAAFYTFTVGAASGFSAACSIVVVNVDTGRGKKMAINGVTFQNGNILFPGQSFILKNINNVWTPVYAQNRWKLPGTTAFFVDVTNGLDTNDGLAAGAGGAWQTIQKSIDAIGAILDLNLQAVTVDVAVGNYPENLWLVNYIGQKSQFGFGQVLIRATNATCANTKINPTSGSGIFATGGNPPYTFQGFQFESPGNNVNLVQMDSGGFVALKSMCFGQTNLAHLLAQFNGSRIAMVASTFRVVGGGSFFMDAQHGANIYFQGGSNVTLVGTPTFTVWARSKNNSDILTSGVTYTGSANAATQLYSAENNGNIDSEDNTPFPGGVAGKVYAGGVYGGLFTESKQGIANHPVLTNIGNPILSSCGTSPGFSTPSNDHAGSFVTGTGATACTVTFAVAWPNSLPPKCVVTALDKASALVYAEGNTTLVLSSASASAGYRYMCAVSQ